MIKASFRSQHPWWGNFYIRATLIMPTWELALIRLQEDDPVWSACNSPTIVSLEEVNEPQTPWGKFEVAMEMKDDKGNYGPYRSSALGQAL